MENLNTSFEELYEEFEERTKNLFSFSSSYNCNLNFNSGGDVVDFNIKILANSKKWFFQSYKETMSETIEKFQKWHTDIQSNFDSLKF